MVELVSQYNPPAASQAYVIVGVNEHSNDSDISINYISSSNEIKINNMDINDNIIVYIYNVLGELVYIRNTNQSFETIDVDFLNTGLYMVQVMGNQNRFMKSILIE